MRTPCLNCIDVTKLGCNTTVNSDVIIYTGPNLPCSTINTQDTITLAFQKIDALLCSISGSQDLQSVLNNGTNAERNGSSVDILTADGDESYFEVNIVNTIAPVVSSTLSMSNDNISLSGNATNAEGGIGINGGLVNFHQGDLAGNTTTLQFASPISESNLLFPAKPTGSYTLSTIEDISIQKILDNPSRTGELDGGNSQLYTMIGGINNRIFQLKTGTNTDYSQINSQNTDVSLENENFGISNGQIHIINGLIQLRQAAFGVGTTFVEILPAIVTSTINFPAPAVAGTYTVATTNQLPVDVSGTVSGIVNNTSLQELGGVDKLIHGVRIGQGSGTGGGNIVIGDSPVLSLNTTGAINTSVGFGTMAFNTTGSYNSAFGNYTLRDNTIGNFNTGVGNGALGKNTSGGYNTGLGTASVSKVTTGNYNTGVGAYSLTNNIIGIGNIAIGFGAANRATGDRNIIIAANPNTTLSGLTTGSNNLIISQNDGNDTGVTTGSGNSIIGKVTGLSSSLSNTVILSDGVGNLAIRKESDNRLLAPSLTIPLINSGGITSLVNKEYVDSGITVLDGNVLHRTGNESFTGIKSGSNSSSGIGTVLQITNNHNVSQTQQTVSLISSSVSNSVLMGMSLQGTAGGTGFLITSISGSTIKPFSLVNISTEVLSISKTGDIIGNSYTGGATLTGTPTAPTATAGTNTTQLATAAFVQDAVKIPVGPIRLKSYTVGTLPSGVLGDIACVTDATAPTYLAVVTGGGAVVCPVFYNGTSWVSH